MQFRRTRNLVLFAITASILSGCNLFGDDDDSTSPPPAPSTDASLSGLSLSSGALSPAFSATQFTYDASVGDAVDSITVTATTTDNNAVLTVNGAVTTSGSPSAAVPLNTGANQIALVVTAEDTTTTETYTVTVTREDPPPSNNAELSGLVLGAGAALTPAFQPGTLIYTATVPNSTDSTTVTATAADSGATLTLNGAALVSGAASTPIALVVGSNELAVNVTAADAITSLSYTVTITRDAPAIPNVSVTALVLDAIGTPVEGAAVSVDGQTGSSTTDAEGRATVVASAADAQLMRVAKDGYVTQSVRLDLADVLLPPTIPVALIEEAAPLVLANVESGGTVTGADGAQVTVPAGAFVDASGQPVTGSINVFMTPVDISDAQARRAFPGSYLATDSGASTGLMASYGTVDFRFEQNGEVLQLAAGQTAEIEIPLFVDSDATGATVTAGQSIGLWFLDESTGVWQQEGTGTVVASAGSPTGFALRGTVTHFSWWNCDDFLRAVEVIPNVYCGEIGTPCELPLSVELCGETNDDGAFTRACTVIDPDLRAELQFPETSPVTLSIDAGPYGASVTPNPLVAGDLAGVLDIVLVPRHQLGGAFLPGDRLAAQMTTIGETHQYNFQGRAGNFFTLAAFPALGLYDEPGLNGGDLGGAVRVIQDGSQLAEAFFEESMQANIEVEIPADGEVIVEFEAQGKVPGFYVATTRVRPPLLTGENGKVAFLADNTSVTGTTNEMFFVPNGASNYQRLSGSFPPPATAIADGVVDNFGFWQAENWRRPAALFKEVAPGKIVYLADEETADVDELFLVDTSQPGVSTKLSGPEVAANNDIIDFIVSDSDPSLIVYQVGSRNNEGGDLYLVDTDAPQNRTAIAKPTNVNVVKITSFAMGRGGTSVLYLVDTDISSATRDGGLYEVQLSTPTSVSQVSPAIDFAGGQRLASFDVSDDGMMVAYIETSSNNSVRELRLLDLATVQTADLVSAAQQKVLTSSFSSDGNHLVYLVERTTSSGTGNLHYVDLSGTAGPAAPVLLNSGTNNAIDSYVIDPSNSVVYFGTNSNRRIKSVALSNPGSESFVVTVNDSDQFSNPVFTPDGSGLIVRAASTAEPDYLLYHRFIDGDDIHTRLSPDFISGSSFGVSHFELAEDGETVFFVADVSIPAQIEVYSVAWRAPVNTVTVVVAAVSGFFINAGEGTNDRAPFILLQ